MRASDDLPTAPTASRDQIAFEESIAEMAADPEIQREIRIILDEFSLTDSDGLSEL